MKFAFFAPKVRLRHVIIAVATWLCIGLVAWEMRTSQLQARQLAAFGQKLTFEVMPKESPQIRFPQAGPYDKRLGYSRLPAFLRRLKEQGYEIEAQSRFSASVARFADWGFTPPYPEKDQAGLRMVDRDGATFFAADFPEQVYQRFDAIPPLIVETLLAIENRELLDSQHPKRNPAIEWDRFFRALFEYLLGTVQAGHRGPGGSTLATQLEKARHSPRGVTGTVREKFRQMASASVRAYLDGEETWETRKRIVLSYLNSLPLAAVPRYGEVIGLAAGLQAWYGVDIKTVNRLLRPTAQTASQYESAARALAYKQVLSLLLAQRRPTQLLVHQPQRLLALTDGYLRLLARQGVIGSELCAQALAASLTLHPRAIPPNPTTFLRRKTVTPIRPHLASLLGVASLYQLDRLDLTVESSLDQNAQEAVTQRLRTLNSTDGAQAATLRGDRLLDRGDPNQVIYSFSLYERGRGVNWLRVQTDNFDQPFVVSEGMKLDLGSTAKLRTLVTYLEIVAALHGHFSGLDPEELHEVPVDRADRLSRWMIELLARTPSANLRMSLEAAMERRYSASPWEEFYTGGGLHRFSNFDRRDNHRRLSVREAFRRSVNLVFIRLMRDIVRHYQFGDSGATVGILRDPQHELRQVYLQRFADQEGRTLVGRFYQKYAGRSPEEALELFLDGVRLTPKRLAAVLRFIEPEASVEAFTAAMHAHLPRSRVSEGAAARLYDTYASNRLDLLDRGHVVGARPLELWLVGYLWRHPEATSHEVLDASAEERMTVYRWLFSTKRKKAQNQRIRTLLEIEAFGKIHQAWKRLGYPFDSLVPSYATALGTSADRPTALAELIGIVLNDGVKYPTRSIARLRFAQGTPYETVLKAASSEGERVLAPEVAAVMLRSLIETVENGTALRARGALQAQDGQPIVIGGKTGTGDHRHKAFERGLRLLAERVVNRTATFVFLIDDDFYGVVTAYVPGAKAAEYGFTGSLAVQVFRALAPLLVPVVEQVVPSVMARVDLDKRNLAAAMEASRRAGYDFAIAPTVGGRDEGPRAQRPAHLRQQIEELTRALW